MVAHRDQTSEAVVSSRYSDGFMVAAAAMSLSSLLVVGNSLRLRAWQPSTARRPAARVDQAGQRERS